jgi:hypothetical protein
MYLLGRRVAMNAPLLMDASWLERVYRAVAWQNVHQIRYSIVESNSVSAFSWRN